MRFTRVRVAIALSIAIGAAAAVGSAYLTYHLRKKAARYFDVSDRTVALAEDGIALTAGLIAIALVKPEKPAAAQFTEPAL